MVDRLVAARLVKRGGRLRTESTHVLAAVRRLNRGELVAESLRCALKELSVHAEDWLAGLITSGWVDRYGRQLRYDRLSRRRGADRLRPADWRRRQVWVQQYWLDEDGQLRWRGPKSTRNRASRRNTEQRSTGKSSADGRPAAATARVPWSSMEIATPRNPEARYSQKITASGHRDWIGYRDRQTETCKNIGQNVIEPHGTDREGGVAVIGVPFFIT
ncbi:hypothetical protein OG787_46705 [Streptomyces sp. NBC_00075]|uniref:hypothetical protein n=1 Tax=Streptomyces sp. NBC_00075 TaxID=2975641 RepID=UPI0032448105